MTALILADHSNGRLASGTYSAIAAGRECSPNGVDVLLVGSAVADIADQVARIDGVSRVLTATAEHYDAPVPEDVAPVIANLASDYTHILAATSAFGRSVIPRLGALLDCQPISDISAIESPDVFRRPIYAGNAIARVQSHEKVKLLTIRATAFESPGLTQPPAPVVETAAEPPMGASRVVDEQLTQSERPELSTAKVVVSGGRGLGSAENFEILDRFAEKLGAAVGASRAAVDAGFVPNDYQVGQTGKVVAPDLYIAVGISGAIQHLAGMKDSKVIVAINKDEDAPIFQVSDYGLVADLFEAVPALQDALEARSLEKAS